MEEASILVIISLDIYPYRPASVAVTDTPL